jgi:outer membrane protein
MKEYTEAKDLEAKIQQSEEKGKQLEAEINRFKQEAANFQAQAQTVAWAQQKGLNYKKESNN